MKKKYSLLVLPALAIIALDQISKSIILRTIHTHETIPIIKGFFNLVHVRNRGMAFGLMNQTGNDLSYYLLITATMGAILILIYWFRRLKNDELKIIFGLSLILGGAIGNLFDRLRFGEVIDFIDVHIAQYHWPAFNVADSAITAGTIWIALNLIFQSSSSG